MPCGWRYIGPRRDSTRLWWGCNHCDVVEVGTKTAGVLLQPPCQRPKLRPEKEPDFYYNPDNWEATYSSKALEELLESETKDDLFVVNRFLTLYKGPERFAVQLPVSYEGGEPDRIEWKWFSTQHEAENAARLAERYYERQQNEAEDREFENDLDSFWQWYCGEGVAVKRAVPRR